MDQSIENTTATAKEKGIEAVMAEMIAARLLESLKPLILPAPEDPEETNPVFIPLLKRLALIEKLCKSVVGVGLGDIPIDAETAAAITGLAVGTIKKYGCYRHIDTIRIGDKLQFSLRSCIELIEKGTRKAVIDCTTEITNYRRKKRTPRSKKSGANFT